MNKVRHSSKKKRLERVLGFIFVVGGCGFCFLNHTLQWSGATLCFVLCFILMERLLQNFLVLTGWPNFFQRFEQVFCRWKTYWKYILKDEKINAISRYRTEIAPLHADSNTKIHDQTSYRSVNGMTDEGNLVKRVQ